MEQPDIINQVFLRYYEMPNNFNSESKISAIKIVGVSERDRNGSIVRYQTIALRDDIRPKRVSEKVRSISVQTLENNWVGSDHSVVLSDKQILDNSINAAAEFLSISTTISESQAKALVSVIAEITSQADRRKLDRAQKLIDKMQSTG